MKSLELTKKINCQNKECNFFLLKKITKKPKYEKDYKIKNYLRKIYQCKKCKHIFNLNNGKINSIYKKEYFDVNYGSKYKKIFNHISNLPLKFSDNKNRVSRLLGFLKNYCKKKIDLLDVGSGLGIFPNELRKKNKDVNIFCLEKDKRFINHLKYNLYFNVYSKINNIKRSFDFIVINKVLEHIEYLNPFISNILKRLKKNGFIYVEVPDVEARYYDIINREEFYIEHHHIFSEVSLISFFAKLNLNLIKFLRIREPSRKFTLIAFFQLRKN